MFAQNVPKEFFELDRFLATGDWDSEQGIKISYRIIANAKTELKNLKGMVGAIETAEELRTKRDALELVLDPYDDSKHHFTDEANNQRKRNQVVDRAKQVLDLLGSERLAQLQIERSAKKLKSRLQDNQSNAFSALSYLDDEYVAGLIQLSEVQKQQYREIFEEAKSKIRKGDSDLFESLIGEHNDHFDRVSKSLNLAESQNFRELVGEPVHWFRDARGRSLISIDVSHLIYTVTVGDYKSVQKDRAGIGEVKPHEFAEHGIEYMYGHVHALLHDPFVWDELDFTNEQRTARKRQLSVMSTSGHHDQRLNDFLDGSVTYPKIMSDFLIPHQMRLFRNLEFQYLTSKFRSSFGLLHPRVAEHFNLTDEQKRQFEKLSKAFQANVEIAEKELSISRNKSVAEFQKQVEDLLSEDQKRILKQLMGHLD